MKAVRSDGAVPAHTDWLVDSLIAGGVLVPRLDATWESVTSVGSRAKRAKATRVSYTLVGSVRVSESVCRVFVTCAKLQRSARLESKSSVCRRGKGARVAPFHTVERYPPFVTATV